MKQLIAAAIAAALTLAALDAYLPTIDTAQARAAEASLRSVERAARLYAFEAGSSYTIAGIEQALAETIIPDGTSITLDGQDLVRRTEDTCHRLTLTTISNEGVIAPC